MRARAGGEVRRVLSRLDWLVRGSFRNKALGIPYVPHDPTAPPCLAWRGRVNSVRVDSHEKSSSSRHMFELEGEADAR